MGRTGRAGLLGAAMAFARSPQGQRMIREARRRYDTPENRALLRDKVTGLRSRRRGQL
jgi:superfamily II DNA/RNA helicase